jgi:glycosyltransferase involved in cell wall biosynthesis
MRIALIRRSYITYLDGVNKFVALLAEGFSKLGHEPLILSWCYGGVDKERLEEWFKEMHGLDNAIPIYTLRSKPFEQGSWMRMAWDWWTRGSKLLRKECMDAAIVNGIIPLRFKPKIAVIHDLGPALTLIKFHAKVGSSLLKGYDKCVAVSDKTKRELLLFSRASCEVIPIPMKLGLFKPAELGKREDLIVHIGTRPVKNPQISVEAVRILKRRYNVRLVVVGTPAEHLKGEEVEWRHGISEKEKLELLSRAKALILPSSYEGFSYACLEAMASGTPVVVSSAVPEEVVIDGFNGLRVNSYDPKDYANALERLLRDEELWSKISKNCLEFVKQFNHIEVANRYVSLIREVYER